MEHRREPISLAKLVQGAQSAGKIARTIRLARLFRCKIRRIILHRRLVFREARNLPNFIMEIQANRSLR